MGDADGALGVGAQQHHLDMRPVGKLALPLAVGVDDFPAVVDRSMLTSRRSERS